MQYVGLMFVERGFITIHLLFLATPLLIEWKLDPFWTLVVSTVMSGPLFTRFPIVDYVTHM